MFSSFRHMLIWLLARVLLGHRFNRSIALQSLGRTWWKWMIGKRCYPFHEPCDMAKQWFADLEEEEILNPNEFVPEIDRNHNE